MKLASSRLTKIVGATSLAVLLVAGLAACSSADNVDKAQLVVDNVKAIDCSSAVDDRAAVVNELKATSDFVSAANAKQTKDILAMNAGLTSLDPLNAELKAKIDACTAAASNAAGSSEKVGVLNADGTSSQLSIYGSPDTTVVVDSTTDPNTPQLLDGSLRYTDQTHSWADLVARVGTQQWYIDGVNARATQTGFGWSDVLKFATVDTSDQDGVESRVIQVYNMPGTSDADVREQVRPYMGPFADTLKIQRINTNFVNTVNVGTKSNPAMGDYVDRQKMIRVTLLPIMFDAAGKPSALDGSKGAGIFIDCGNLHWVPPMVYACTDSSCAPPACPAGMIGDHQPNCTPPPITTCESNCGGGCTVDCGGTTCPPGQFESPTGCHDSKDPANDNAGPGGWDIQGPGTQTSDHVSEDQQSSGEVSGNVTDNPVPSGTGSGDTTPDLPSGTVTAPGASSGGDDTSDDATDTTVTNPDTGGTDGDTEIGVPAD